MAATNVNSIQSGDYRQVCCSHVTDTHPSSRHLTIDNVCRSTVCLWRYNVGVKPASSCLCCSSLL
jgi:hypothetical protein